MGDLYKPEIVEFGKHTFNKKMPLFNARDLAYQVRSNGGGKNLIWDSTIDQLSNGRQYFG